jgi:hypothetical protein
MPSNANLHGVSFYEGGDSITGATAGASRILYFFDRTAPDPDDWTIMRRVGNGTPQAIVSSGLYIEKADFIVTGSDTLVPSGDVIQPTITVYIEAREKNSTTDKIYRLQTTVTQRILDL